MCNDQNNFIKTYFLCIDVVNSFGENKCMFSPSFRMRFGWDNTSYRPGELLPVHLVRPYLRVTQPNKVI